MRLRKVRLIRQEGSVLSTEYGAEVRVSGDVAGRVDQSDSAREL